MCYAEDPDLSGETSGSPSPPLRRKYGRKQNAPLHVLKCLVFICLLYKGPMAAVVTQAKN